MKVIGGCAYAFAFVFPFPLGFCFAVVVVMTSFFFSAFASDANLSPTQLALNLLWVQHFEAALPARYSAHEAPVIF